MSESRMTPHKARQLIRALMARTTERGCTEAEALEAAEKVAKLQDQYGFAQLDAEEEVETIEQAIWKVGGSKLNNMARVASAVAVYCDCKLWYSRPHHRGADGKTHYEQTIRFLGRKSDTEMAIYLMDLFDAMRRVQWDGYQFDRRRERHWEQSAPHLKGSFEIGMMDRLAKRLYDMKRERNARVYDGGRTGNELVLVKNVAVEAAYAVISKGFRKGHALPGSKAHLHDEAVVAGRNAADQVNLQRPIGNERKEQLP